MRILLIDQFADLGGAQQVLLEVAAGCAARGWELHAALPVGPVVERLASMGVRVNEITCGPFTSVRKGALDLVRFATQLPGQVRTLAGMADSVDMLYVNGPRMVAAAAMAAGGRPLLFHSHSVVTQRAVARMMGAALRYKNASIVASSRYVTGWLAPFVDASRIQVIYNGVAGFGAPARPRAAFTRIGMLGRIAPEKGQLEFVHAARIAAMTNHELRFSVCGSPMYASDSYFDTVRRAAGPEVTLLPWTDDVGGFFRGIDILVVPSDAVDANPRVIPEAFSAGVPVIAFRSGGVPELMEQGVSGLMVEQRTPEALAAAILAAVHDPVRLNALAEQGYQRWQSRFTLERFQSEVCQALEKVQQSSRVIPDAPFLAGDLEGKQPLE